MGAAAIDEERPCIYRTKALGTIAELLVTDPHVIVAASTLLHEELERIDRAASRFRPDSDIIRLNRSAGSEVTVSQDLLEAVQVALGMAEATQGAVDPTVGQALCRLGYDRDFADVAGGVRGRLPRSQPAPGWSVVGVNERTRTVSLPAGVSLDLGATAKALASDRAAASIHARLGCGVLVSLGGDVAVAGPPPPGGFSVGLADACTERSATEAVRIDSGGLATSGIGVRQWTLGRHRVHHIVNPATGLPAPTCWRTVATTAASCVQANAASTASVVMGDAALDWLNSHHLPARLVAMDGTVHYTHAWPAQEVVRQAEVVGIR